MEHKERVRIKQNLRKTYLQKRETISTEEANAASHAISEHFFKHIPLTEQDIISGYISHKSELNIRPLMDSLHAKGHQCALPITPKPENPLEFRSHHADDTLVIGRFDVFQPLPTAPVVIPTIVIMPLLAFDRKGNRLGYGGGYYDRTINHLTNKGHKTIVIGIGYASQEADSIPHGPHDIDLHYIITEKEVIVL